MVYDLRAFSLDNGADNSFGGDSGTTFSEKRSNGIPFGYRDQREGCNSFQLQSYQSQSFRVYEYCANSDMLDEQPRVIASSSCLTKVIYDQATCSNGCFAYQIKMPGHPFDNSHCSYYKARYNKYLDEFVEFNPCGDSYWRCYGANAADVAPGSDYGVVLEVVVLTPQADHINSMTNDMFIYAQQSYCR